MEDKDTIILTDYICGSCQGSSFKLQVGHSSNGNTYLITSCANEDCREARQQELIKDGEDEEHFIYWDCFDITGQDYDEDNMLEENNPHREFKMTN